MRRLIPSLILQAGLTGYILLAVSISCIIGFAMHYRAPFPTMWLLKAKNTESQGYSNGFQASFSLFMLADS